VPLQKFRAEPVGVNEPENVELAKSPGNDCSMMVLNLVLVVTNATLRTLSQSLRDHRPLWHVKVRTKGPYRTLPAWRASAGPATAGQGRKPRSGGAERASLYRVAPVRPHGDKRVTMLGIFMAPLGTLIAPAPVSCRNSIRCRQHRALCR
jgi:hypothetical protein